MRPSFTWLLTGSAAVLLTAVVVLTGQPPRQVPVSGSTGEALVGGPFTMVDHTGKTVTQEDFAGRLMLIYFGFTFCPDVCPTRLLTITRALQQLGDDIDKVQPIFVTIDPQRDQVASLKDYLAHFHPKFIGLTGTPDQVAAMADAYKVTYYRVRDENMSDYMMDHTDIVYLMDGQNKYLDHFGPTAKPEEIAQAIKAHF